jgi:putative hydrolase
LPFELHLCYSQTMLHDFHTHTSLSDGELSPMEMIRRAAAAGYTSVALTDHASTGDVQRIVPEIVQVCALARQYWDILAIPGIELTHAPAKSIVTLAKEAKKMGAWIVVVHGETIVEPVEKGTNLAALSSPDVDILAHPGFITLPEAKLAAASGVLLEITARKGHSLTNGHVAKMAIEAGARMILGSDAHSDCDLLTAGFAEAVLLGTGMEKALVRKVLSKNTQELLSKINLRQV